MESRNALLTSDNRLSYCSFLACSDDTSAFPVEIFVSVHPDESLTFVSSDEPFASVHPDETLAPVSSDEPFASQFPAKFFSPSFASEKAFVVRRSFVGMASSRSFLPFLGLVCSTVLM